MSFKVYEVATSKIFISYDNETAAKRRCTRLNNQVGFAKYAVAPEAEYYANIEQMVTRTNLMTGVQYQESVNVPYTCSPCSETYWSS